MQNILIVDSSPDVVTLFKYIFPAANYRLGYCPHVNNLFTSLQLSIPDLIILDVHLSGEEEMKVCRDLQNTAPFNTIPILITSAKKIHVVNYKDFYAADAIEKPFTASQLRNKVQSLLEG